MKPGSSRRSFDSRGVWQCPPPGERALARTGSDCEVVGPEAIVTPVGVPASRRPRLLVGTTNAGGGPRLGDLSPLPGGPHPPVDSSETRGHVSRLAVDLNGKAVALETQWRPSVDGLERQRWAGARLAPGCPDTLTTCGQWLQPLRDWAGRSGSRCRAGLTGGRRAHEARCAIGDRAAAALPARSPVAARPAGRQRSVLARARARGQDVAGQSDDVAGRDRHRVWASPEPVFWPMGLLVAALAPGSCTLGAGTG